jgi:D-glycero-beta-D-manno-heptose-7-phosphate kinase
MTEQRCDALLESFKGRTIAILGDLMLDRYYWGTVRRISPEAPVPVVEVESEQTRFGGAANVANNIQALGGFPVLVGLIGDDHPGRVFMEMIREQNFDSGGIILDAERPTTIKTRVIAQGQHVVRIDNESRVDCPKHLMHLLVDAIKYNIRRIDGIIIEDYNKGVLTKSVIDEVIAVARKYGKIVAVDPKFENFLEYRGATVFKPNRREAEEALGRRLRTIEDVEAVGKYLLETLKVENVLLTRGEEGMSLFEGNGNVLHMGTEAENVQDVSGAGDTVISTMTMALSSGATVRESCVLANCAGGVVVGAVGIVPIRPDQLKEAVRRSLARPGGSA